MTTENLFSFMKEVAPEFAQLGERIETSLFDQPNNILVQARLYGEELGKYVSKHEEIEKIHELKHVDRIHKLLRSGAIEEDIFEKFDWLRKAGNKAAHETGFGNVELAIRAHKYVHELSVWYVKLYVSFDFETPSHRIPERKPTSEMNPDSLTSVLKPLLNESIESAFEERWKEMQKEIESLKQMNEKNNKIEEKQEEQPNPPQAESVQDEADQFGLFSYLEKHNLEVIDKRHNNGTIWVVGGWELKDTLFALKEHKVFFRFAKKGSRSTKKRPAWFMMNKWHETREEEMKRLK